MYGYPYAVGAADPFGSAQVNAKMMEDRLRAIEPGAAFGHVAYTDEVAAYQKAGQFGVDVVAPSIDAAGSPNVTQPLTHQAWGLNDQLHKDIRSWGPIGPGYQDMQQARTLAWKMLVTYKQAIVAGKQAVNTSMQQQIQQRRAPSPAPAPSGPLQTAAQALLAAIHAATQAGQPVRWTREHGQSSLMWQPTEKFQRAYNTAARGNLKVDGVFGPDTTAALQSVVGTNAIQGARGVPASAAVAGVYVPTGYAAGLGGFCGDASGNRWCALPQLAPLGSPCSCYGGAGRVVP